MEKYNFRKTKIIFKEGENEVKTDFFEELLKDENLSLEEKWFLRGCKHITERHYTEAIKRFQLSKNVDSVVMILSISFKIADRFMFDEYFNQAEDFKEFGKMFKRFGIKPYLDTGTELKEITPELIKKLKEALN